MKSWPIKPLGEFVEEHTERLGHGVATIYSVTNENGFVRSLDLFDKQVFSKDTGSYKRVVFRDLAYNPSRINVGSVAMCDDKDGGAVSPMYVVVRCKPGLLPRYLLYFLKSAAGLEQICHRCEGAVRFQLKFRDLCAIPMSIPPAFEQERIVALLDEVDELRKLREQAYRRTENLIPALFNEMFVGSSDFPSATVAELATQRDRSIRTGPFGSDLLHSEFVDEGIPVLGIDNVVANEFRWDKVRCVTPEKFAGLRRFVVFPGDVLVTIMGTVGRSVVAPDDLPLSVSTKHLCAITVDRERIEPRYLWGSLLFDESVRTQTRAVAKGAIMEGWNSTIIKRLAIRVPPLTQQREFAEQVTEIRELETRQAASRMRLENLFQSTLYRAFAGEL